MNIIRMAREAGAWSQQFKNRDVDYVMSAESLERFATLVAAAERERFALECIDIVAMHGGSVEIEAAIRATKGEKNT